MLSIEGLLTFSEDEFMFIMVRNKVANGQALSWSWS